MRTTLEIFDDILRKAKLQAVQEGVALKDVVTPALRRELAPGSASAALRKARAERLLQKLDQAGNTRPVGRLNRKELYDRPVLRGH
jgi:hypothetical protein